MRKHFIFYLFTVLILLLSFNSNGQIISGNAFLQGNYIRLGMTENAAFGSGVNGPPGLLPIGADVRNTPVCNLGKLGFAADVGKDGWTVGTPAFIGDYFLPGTPEEGWSVSLNGLHYNNNRSPLYIPGFSDQCVGGTQINGAFINFVDLPDKQVATWDGLVNGLRIVKTITLPKNKLYFIIEIKMYNTTSSTISDVYYMRNVDPDNEVAQVGSGGYPTNNTIEFQNPSSSNKALVSARGQSYNSYLGLGSIDCRARVCIRGGRINGNTCQPERYRST